MHMYLAQVPTLSIVMGKNMLDNECPVRSWAFIVQHVLSYLGTTIDTWVNKILIENSLKIYIFHHHPNQDTIICGYSWGGYPRICSCRYQHTFHSFGSRNAHVFSTSTHFIHRDDWLLFKLGFPTIHKETDRIVLP